MNQEHDTQLVSTSSSSSSLMSGATGNDEQRYLRWWEKKSGGLEPGSVFELLYDDNEIVVDAARYVVDGREWTPEYVIDERYACRRLGA